MLPSFRAALVDLKANRGRPKIQVLLVMFRLAHQFRVSESRIVRAAGRPMVIAYRVTSEIGCGIELPARTTVGARLRIHHGYGLVVHADSILGDDVTLRQGVTIGNIRESGGCPTVGDGCEFGAGSVVVGPVEVPAGRRIRANQVVWPGHEPWTTALDS